MSCRVQEASVEWTDGKEVWHGWVAGIPEEIIQRAHMVTMPSDASQYTWDATNQRSMYMTGVDCAAGAYQDIAVCDRYPIRSGTQGANDGSYVMPVEGGAVYCRVDGETDLAGNVAAIAGMHVLYAMADPTTASLDAVTLPALPAPDATVWADTGEVPTDVSLKYEQDINIVIDELKSAIVASVEGTQ